MGNLKFGPLGLLDSLMGGLMAPGMSAISGLGKGMLGTGLNLTNHSLLGKLTHSIGYGVGRTAVTAAKPIISVAGHMAKNTPNGVIRASKGAQGLWHMGMKKSASGSAHNLLGYEARALTPSLLTAGAVGIGVMRGMKDEDYNLGLRTAVNGVMDSEGCMVTPGSINDSFTPVTSGRRSLNNFGATGELGLALHQKRNSGYL